MSMHGKKVKNLLRVLITYDDVQVAQPRYNMHEQMSAISHECFSVLEFSV